MGSTPIPPGSPIPSSQSFPPHPSPPVRRASTSSVTIPIPGKSILKKPPPPPSGLFSRITMGSFGKFFGGNNPSSSGNSPSGIEPPSGWVSDRSSNSTSTTAAPPPDPALKRAHFILPHMAVVYPISSTAPPRTPTTQLEKRAIEDRERERRRRVVSSEATTSVSESSPLSSSEMTTTTTTPTPTVICSFDRNAEYRYGLPSASSNAEPGYTGSSTTTWWGVDKVEAFYNECCSAYNEPPDPAISQALLRHSTSTSLTTLSTSSGGSVIIPPNNTSTPAPRTLDLTGISLTSTQAEILADLLSIEWGLRTLILCESNLDPVILKPILHALLLHNTLIYLSVASNAGLASKSLAGRGAGYGLSLGMSVGGGITKTAGAGSAAGAGGPVTGWVVLEAYLMRSNLKVLDLSRNVLDKRAMEGIVRGALREGVPSGTGTAGTTTPTPNTPSSDISSSPSPSSLISLTLDSTTLKSGAIEILARAVRSSSSLRTLSLRNCRIGGMGSRGGIAVSLMIRDWPDTVAGQSTIGLGASSIGIGANSSTSTPNGSRASTPIQPQITGPGRAHSLNRNRPPTLTNLDLESDSDRSLPGSPRLGSAALPSSHMLPSSAKPPLHPLSSSLSSAKHPSSKPLLPPPRHPPLSEGVPPPPLHPTSAKVSATQTQTTYTPYVPRSKRALVASVPSAGYAGPTIRTNVQPNTNANALNTPPLTPITPTLTTVSRGGVTAAAGVEPVVNSIIHGGGSMGAGVGAQSIPPSVAALHSASAALLSQVRALDALPRIGSLRTLDLRGNELRSHISYLAQVLKRNRTLKTLNLQDNKLDPKALVVIAEALKYNAALEELDLGRNPCCGIIAPLSSSSVIPGVGSVVGTGSGSTSGLSRTSTASSISSTSTISSGSGYGSSYITPTSSTTAYYSNKSTPTGSVGKSAYSTQPSSSSVSSSTIPSSHPAMININLGLEGIHALRLALALNTTLTRLSLSATHLGDAGAIALAEWMGEYNGLRWLDLTRNSAVELGAAGAGLGLGEAGVMALAQGVKVNKTLRCLDVEVPPGVEGYAKLSREILNTCIRNVEASAKEQAEQLERVQFPNPNDVEGQDPAEWRVTKDPVHRARDCVVALRKHLDSGVSVANDVSADALLRRSKASLDDLTNVISGMLDSSFDNAAKEEKMRQVLELSDELGTLVAKVEQQDRDLDGSDTDSQLTQMPPDIGTVSDEDSLQQSSETTREKERPNLRVHVPQKQNQNPKSTFEPKSTATTIDRSPFTITDLPTSSIAPAQSDDDDDDLSSITPSRADKGKARAPPEPVRHEPVLSPTAVLLRNGVRGASSLGASVGLGLGSAGSEDGMSESEGENGDDYDGEGGEEGEDVEGEPEAGVRSRSWVAEEGEVFRKGNVLLGPEEMEGEYAGEDLRRELLEAMVERPAPRSLRLDDVDEYGVTLPSPSIGSSPSTPLMSPSTPTINSASLTGPSTPLATLPEDGYPFHGGTTPTQDSVMSASTTSPSLAVRPYVPRTRSTSAVPQNQAETDGQGQSTAYISRRRSNENLSRGPGSSAGVGVGMEQ